MISNSLEEQYLNFEAVEMGQCCQTQVSQGGLDHQIEAGAKLDLVPLSMRKFNSAGDLSLPEFKPRKKLTRQQTFAEEEITLRLTDFKKKKQSWLEKSAKTLMVLEEEKQEFLDFHQLIHLFQKCTYLYEMHDLDSSFGISKEISTLKEKIKFERKITEEQFINKLKEVERQWAINYPGEIITPFENYLLEKIEGEMKNLKFYEDIVARSPFEEKYNKKGIKISMRPQGSTVGVQLETVLKVPFEEFATLLTEVNYFSDFIPFCEYSQMLKDRVRNEKVGYARFNFPIVSKREGYFKGTSYLRFKSTGEVFIYIRSLDEEELKKEQIEAKYNEDYVRLRFNYFVITYQPIQEGVGNLKFSFCIDNGINFMPSFIEEMVTKKVGKELFQKLLEFSNDFEGSKWEKCMEANPEFSIFIRQQITERLEQLRQNQIQQS